MSIIQRKRLQDAKTHIKRMPIGSRSRSERSFTIPKSFHSMKNDLDETIKALKKKYKFKNNQGMILPRIDAMAKDELGNDFRGWCNPEEVPSWLYLLKPHQMIITQTAQCRKEPNHAIPIVCVENTLAKSEQKPWYPYSWYAFDPIDFYGKFGSNPQHVYGHPYPQWFQHLFFCNKYPTQGYDQQDCAIRAVAWLKMYQKYGMLFLQLHSLI